MATTTLLLFFFLPGLILCSLSLFVYCSCHNLQLIKIIQQHFFTSAHLAYLSFMVLRPASGNLAGPAGREQKQRINGPKAVEADQAPGVKTLMGYLIQF